MHDPLDVRRPHDMLRILRPRYHKARTRKASCGLDQQTLQRRLTIGAIGSHVAQVPLPVDRLGIVERRIDRAVERASAACAIPPLKLLHYWPTAEREIEVIARE